MIFSGKSEADFDDPSRVPVSTVAQHLSKFVNQVRGTKQRLIITKNGRAIAAICPLTYVAIVDEVVSSDSRHRNSAFNIDKGPAPSSSSNTSRHKQLLNS